jgi:8-oxo-dGTP pyrophosphatase MutT (NUDIX family)
MKKTLPPGAILIPDNASKAFEGQIFDVYQWPQPMFDGTTKTFEMLRRPDTVQVILVRGDEILLVDDEQPGRTPRLHFPGGRADDDDISWEAAAQRELREESGYVCSYWKLIDVQQPTPKIEWFTPIFVANDITQELPQQLDTDGEKITLQWRPFDTVRAAVLSGKEPTMEYLLPLFTRVRIIEDLLDMAEFNGEEIHR